MSNSQANFWNIRHPENCLDLDDTPICPVCPLEVAVELKNKLMAFVILLQDDAIHLEFQVLHQFLVRIGFVRRKDGAWKSAWQADRCLKRFRELKLDQACLLSVFRQPESKKRKGVVAVHPEFSSLSDLNYTVQRLIGAAKLLTQARSHCLTSLAELQSRLKLGNEISELVTLMGNLSRIVIICQILLLETAKLYYRLKVLCELMSVYHYDGVKMCYPSNIWEFLGLSMKEVESGVVMQMNNNAFDSTTDSREGEIQSVDKSSNPAIMAQRESISVPDIINVIETSICESLPNSVPSYDWMKDNDIGIPMTRSTTTESPITPQPVAKGAALTVANGEDSDVEILETEPTHPRGLPVDVKLPSLETVKDLRELWRQLSEPDYNNGKSVPCYKLTESQKRYCKNLVEETCNEVRMLKKLIKNKLDETTQKLQDIISNVSPVEIVTIRDEPLQVNGNTLSNAQHRSSLRNKKPSSPLFQLKSRFKCVRNYKALKMLFTSLCNGRDAELNAILPKEFDWAEREKLKQKYRIEVLSLKGLSKVQGKKVAKMRRNQILRDIWRSVMKGEK